MKIYCVLRICDHFYFILNQVGARQVPVTSCHVWKCPDASDVAKLRFFLKMKIILEVLKIDLFEGLYLHNQIH